VPRLEQTCELLARAHGREGDTAAEAHTQELAREVLGLRYPDALPGFQKRQRGWQRLMTLLIEFVDWTGHDVFCRTDLTK
jgi:hypothetical protein